MNRLSTSALACIITLSMGACVKQESEEDAIPEGYKRSLDKANAVEKTLQDTTLQRLEDVDTNTQ